MRDDGAVSSSLERPLVLPSADDPVVAGAVGAVGGPPGRHAHTGRRWLTPVRVVVLLTLVTCALGFWQKTPCRSPGNWVEDYQYTRACYMDTLPLYSVEKLSEGQLPYLDHETLEYPVLIGGIMALAAEVVEPLEPSRRPRAFVDVTILLMTAGAVVVAATTARLAGRRPWDAAMFALAPGLLLAGFINWDLAAAALVGLGLLAWARRRPVLAGIALGLGIATKLYPVVLLVPLVALCLRTRQWRAGAATVLAAAGAWLAVNLPIMLAAPEAWRHFYEFSQQRGADWGSLWYLMQSVRGPLDGGLVTGETPHVLNTSATLATLVLLAAVALLALLAPRRPRLPQVMFLALAAFLLCNKVWSPQFVIWILPLAVLARPRWRAFLAWQATEVLAFFGIWYFLIHVSDPGKGIGEPWYFGSVLLRDAALLALCALVVREILHPELDVVRRDGEDDPAGGVLDGAPDAWRRTPEQASQPEPAPAAG